MFLATCLAKVTEEDWNGFKRRIIKTLRDKLQEGCYTVQCFKNPFNMLLKYKNNGNFESSQNVESQ